MTTTPRYRDEELMAFADGELPAHEAMRIRTAALSDAALAARIAGFTHTGRGLSASFADKLSEPVPDALLQLLQAPAASATVQPLHAAPRRRVAAQWPVALAASLAVALGVSLWWPRAADVAAPLPAGLPTSAAALSAALDTTPSGEPVLIADGAGQIELLPTATLRDAEGRYCREFGSTALASGAEARGLACREGGAWAVQVAATGTAAAGHAGSYRPASGASLAAAQGQRLGEAEERALIARGWR